MSVVVMWYAGVTVVLACVLAVVVCAQWVADRLRGVPRGTAGVGTAATTTGAATAAGTAGAAATGAAAPGTAATGTAPTATGTAATAMTASPADSAARLPRVDLRPPAGRTSAPADRGDDELLAAAGGAG